LDYGIDLDEMMLARVPFEDDDDPPEREIPAPPLPTEVKVDSGAAAQEKCPPFLRHDDTKGYNC
jgi:hypothetical protein